MIQMRSRNSESTVLQFGQMKHLYLRKLLDVASVEYQYPEFIGENHKPHVTARQGAHFDVDSELTSHFVYLIEVVDTRRVIRSTLGWAKPTKLFDL